VLDDLTVTTDSVVATATVDYEGTPGLVTVDWGDGTIESRNPADPTDSPFPDPWTPSDPPGTSVFQHAYAAPADGARFTATVTARIGAESQARAVFVTPRYRVTYGTASLSIIDACESSFETTTEWQVDRTDSDGGGLVGEMAWEFEESTNGFPPHALPDSAFQVDVSVQAGGKPEVGYLVLETDWLYDDNNGRQWASLVPLSGGIVQLGSHRVHLWTQDGSQGSECRGELTADVDTQLLTPGLGGGPVAGR
jgi:hypothetical protein